MIEVKPRPSPDDIKILKAKAKNDLKEKFEVRIVVPFIKIPLEKIKRWLWKRN